jgi:hypothetical protein
MLECTTYAMTIMAYGPGHLDGQPVAVAVGALYGLSWLTLSPETLGWHGLVTLTT